MAQIMDTPIRNLSCDLTEFISKQASLVHRSLSNVCTLSSHSQSLYTAPNKPSYLQLVTHTYITYLWNVSFLSYPVTSSVKHQGFCGTNY